MGEPKYPNGRKPSQNGRATEFLSRGFESLVGCLQETNKDNNTKSGTDIHYDLIVVGSGYGGAIAALEFSKSIIKETGKKPRICILERGKERLPGTFPSTLAQLPTELRLYRNNSDDEGIAQPTVQGNESGLFDIRVGDGCSTLIANGLGGGSLINAGVMLEPESSVFESPMWPRSISNDPQLNDLFSEAKELLGASIRNNHNKTEDNTVLRSQRSYSKYRSLESLAGSRGEVKAVPITVRLNDSDPDQTIKTDNCIDCGDCFSGCNFNAKKSLDTNVLASAALFGVEIFCNTTVNSFDKLNDGRWELLLNHTDQKMNRHFTEETRLRCSKLIVAAGTLGSTELLLQSELHSKNNLRFSERVGSRFSGNGDMLATISNRSEIANSVASEKKAPGARNVGPTITGMIDFRGSGAGDVAIQELSVPAILHRLTTEATAFSQTVDSITRGDKAGVSYSDEFCTLKPCGPLGKYDRRNKKNISASRDGSESDNITILALMGLDKLAGELSLPNYYYQNTDRWFDSPTQGILNLKFPSESDEAEESEKIPKGENENSDILDKTFYEKNSDLIRQLTSSSDENAWVHDNPLWKPLGSSLEKLFNVSIPGMLITVHPLGGCPIGTNSLEGVVDEYGRVFDGASGNSTDIHEGLVVLDGSILPTPAGINPALTIATLSLRASRWLTDDWDWSQTESTGISPPIVRPQFKTIDPMEVTKKKPTTLELVERLTGSVVLTQKNESKEYVVELRIRSEPFEIEEYTRFLKRDIPLLSEIKKDADNSLPDRSYIRIFDKREWDKHHDIMSIMSDRDSSPDWTKKKRAIVEQYYEELDKYALFTAPITGHITMLEEIPRSKIIRTVRGFAAWAINRGIRDIRQSIWAGFRSGSVMSSVGGYFRKETFAGFANSGRERRLSYHLNIGSDLPLVRKNIYHEQEVSDLSALVGKVIKGHKTFQYKIGSNPWRQLMDIELTEFPCLNSSTLPMLKVDPEYFAKTSAPLLHISDEDNAVDGYADLLFLYTHTFRLFILQHLWTLRKPDTKTKAQNIAKENDPSTSTAANRLPPDLSSLSNIKYDRFPLELNESNNVLPGNPQVEAYLTRYRVKSSSDQPPILCIHGYSASGTTFAHSTLYGGEGRKGGLAAYLANLNREVWILDMRSSCAVSGRRTPWTFEDMAFKDIPVAISQVCEMSGHSHIDVVAHCMGAAMLSMTLLGEPKKSADKIRIETTPTKIRKIALSQAGPFLRFTSANTLRAYTLNYIRKLMPQGGYEFTPQDPNSAANVLLDRFLNTVPYPDTTEFKAENPLFSNAYWVRARHRMDALYGRTFNLKNVNSKTLDHIDDFFGPLSFQTLEQTLWISRRKQISDWEGHSYYLKRDNFVTRWNHPTLWIHGEKNGLIDPRSPSLTALICDEQELNNFEFEIIPDTGHQDCLIGENCEVPFGLIAKHLE